MIKKKEGGDKNIVSSSIYATLILVALSWMAWQSSLIANDRAPALFNAMIGVLESQILIDKSTLLNKKYREWERKEIDYAKNN